MNVPNEIQQVAAAGLQLMRADPQHHFDWRTRRTMYQRFQLVGSNRAARAHSWLAILAAEHVLPIFTATFPTDRLPARLMRYARRVVTGQLGSASWRITILEDSGYMGTGIDMLELRDGVIAYNAEYAGAAAYKALVETRGARNLLEGVEALRPSDETMMIEGTARVAWPDHRAHDGPLTDADIAHLAAFSDTASAAAIAYACEREHFQLNADKLQLFWEWWIETALLEAWRCV